MTARYEIQTIQDTFVIEANHISIEESAVILHRVITTEADRHGTPFAVAILPFRNLISLVEMRSKID